MLNFKKREAFYAALPLHVYVALKRPILNRVKIPQGCFCF